MHKRKQRFGGTLQLIFISGCVRCALRRCSVIRQSFWEVHRSLCRLTTLWHKPKMRKFSENEWAAYRGFRVYPMLLVMGWLITQSPLLTLPRASILKVIGSKGCRAAMLTNSQAIWTSSCGGRDTEKQLEKLCKTYCTT